jgi:hypothetical protein
MRGLGCDVDDALAALQRIHEIRKGLPLPGQSCGQHRVRNFLDPIHQVHQGLAMMLLHWRETHTAISEKDGRHTMPARGCQQRVPHRLTVVVRVHVDPSRRNHQAHGIDLAPGRSLLAADGGDPAFCNGNVAAEGGLAGAIHDRAATNNDVVHACVYRKP